MILLCTSCILRLNQSINQSGSCQSFLRMTLHFIEQLSLLLIIQLSNLISTLLLTGLSQTIYLFTLENVVQCCFPGSVHTPDHALRQHLEVCRPVQILGLAFCPDVSWSSHINDICNKARRLIGLLYRRFYKLYCLFIRPRLEYASVAIVWSPYLIKDISTIEKVKSLL